MVWSATESGWNMGPPAVCHLAPLFRAPGEGPGALSRAVSFSARIGGSHPRSGASRRPNGGAHGGRGAVSGRLPGARADPEALAGGQKPNCPGERGPGGEGSAVTGMRSVLPNSVWHPAPVAASASQGGGIGKEQSRRTANPCLPPRRTASTHVAPQRVRFFRPTLVPTRSRAKPRSIARRCRSRWGVTRSPRLLGTVRTLYTYTPPLSRGSIERVSDCSVLVADQCSRSRSTPPAPLSGRMTPRPPYSPRNREPGRAPWPPSIRNLVEQCHQRALDRLPSPAQGTGGRGPGVRAS